MNQFFSIWLAVGVAVPRDDGQFNVPIRSPNHPDQLSKVLVRVASDAFETVEEAEAFAVALADCWNKHRYVGALL